MAETAAVRAWLSVGSNIDRQANISRALRELKEEFGELVISPIYESTAVGCEGENFYNLVAGIETSLSIPELNHRLRQIEERNGRRRGADKFAPRSLDIDLLTYGERIYDEQGIQLPRDEITRYAFVLLPLSEVAGDEIHPLTGLSYRELWAGFDADGQKLWRV